jgi:tight adherence protein B
VPAAPAGGVGTPGWRSRRETRRLGPGRRSRLLLVLVVAAAAVALRSGVGALPAVALACGSVAAVALLRRRRWTVAARANAVAVPAVTRLLATALQGGASPADALDRAAVAGGPLAAPLRAAAARARFGGSSTTALSVLATSPGAVQLAAVAACWQVADETGASAPELLGGLATVFGEDARAHEDARAQLAGARRSAQLLAVLPVGGLLLAASAGVPAARILFESGAGHLILAAAAALDAVGWWWSARLLSRAAED